jgi:hypothetical protein
MEIRMKTTTLLAGSVALCALAGAIATPGYAQGAQPQYSTPAEQAQTRELNQQAADGTAQPPDTLNGQYAQSSQYGAPGSQNNDSAPPPSAQQQQYDEQMQQYGQQREQYQDQRQRYDSDNARYRANLRAYDRTMYDWQYPAPIEYRYSDDRDLRRLYLIADPTHQLARLPVEGPDGRWVGRVRNVETALDGRPARVEIALNRRVSVWVHPGDLRYDADNHVVFTDLTRADLWQMPGATVESGPL